MADIKGPQARRRGGRGVRGELLWLSALLGAAPLGAQQARVPVRDLGPVVATTKQPLVFFYGLWQFADGRVLLNDALGRRLYLYDSMFTAAAIVGDSVAGSPILVGRAPIPFIPYVGDSVLYLDLTSSSILMIAPGGKVARALAPPKASDMVWMRSGVTAADAKGRLVYRGRMPARAGAPGTAPVVPDSAPIVRADFDSRTIDTVALITTPPSKPLSMIAGPDGKLSVLETIVPISIVDDWTVHADGSIAIVRGIDYHIDWIAPDGSRSSSPKISFDWRRLTDEDKTRMIDSTLAVWNSRPQINRALTLGEARSFRVGNGLIDLETAARVTAIDSSLGVAMVAKVVAPAELPDYVPSIRSGALKADRDGNLWILPNTSAQSRKGGLVYDIVNRRGELTERVELPVGRSIAGFGPGGNVYLLSGDRTKGYTIERARFK